MTTGNSNGNAHSVDFDALIVGAGFSGLYMLHDLRQQGLSVKVVEQGGGVGGTWYWNRYPGARCDSESVYYMFSERFSKEILQEWTWSERYVGQPEILDYLNFVADKMDLRRDIQFNTRVTSAIYDEEHNRWEVTTEDGTTTSARYLITAVGCLSTTNMPKFPGLENFAGDWYHTGAWPHEPVDFTGKRVAVIGTGCTGIQVVPEVAEEASKVWVLQRTPNYAIPTRNGPLDSGASRSVKDDYEAIWQRARESGFGYPYASEERSALDYSPEERESIYEAAWAKGGFYIGIETFSDFLANKDSNDTISDFLRSKIRETVHDPATAELLTPKDYPFFTKRPPLETGYFEAFNRDNVALVDVRATPITEITEHGVRTTDAEYEVDAIIFATGFDSMTGTLFRMGIRGVGGLKLEDKWADGPRTYLGLTAHGFPNLFIITGPQSPSVLANMPVAIEQNTEWIAGLIAYMRDRGIDYVEATEDAEDRWVAHHNELAQDTLLLGTDSWWVGANIPGKARTLYPYVGGVGVFRETCQQVADNGYEGFTLLERAPTP
jgi:cation diffusion facilitator CzcD-associated flavoprotein CzcO